VIAVTFVRAGCDRRLRIVRQEAHLASERKRHNWQWWELITQAHEPGVATLRARATDLAGRTQPERAEWNRLGYGNNAIHEVPARIV
jgi:Mo-co oxidoreductase dimerisation domain